MDSINIDRICAYKYMVNFCRRISNNNTMQHYSVIYIAINYQSEYSNKLEKLSM